MFLQKTAKHACNYWEKKKETLEYEQFLLEHDCPINHEKSSGSMESAGAVTIFNRSIVCNKLRYKTYIGDGDTQSYHEVVKNDPYPGFSIKKGDGHVQKRLGTHLQNLRTKLKGTKLSDGKPLIRKGRSTEKIINLLQNYYGMAIRQNTKTVPEMRKAIGAVLYHCSESSPEETRHL